MKKRAVSSIKSLRDRITKQNEKFEKATKEEKRVMIAQDCIDRIRLAQLNPQRQSFVLIPSAYDCTSESVKSTLNSTSKDFSCRVCAKGGLFMSYIGRVNDCNFVDIEVGNSAYDYNHERLLEIFSIEQLDLIEIAFEGHSHLHTGVSGFFRAGAFYNKYPDADKRLIAICENIIENKGTFIP